MDEGTEAIINAELDAIEASRDRWKILSIVLLAVFALGQIPDAWSHPGHGRFRVTDERPQFVMDMLICEPTPTPAQPICHALWHWNRNEPVN